MNNEKHLVLIFLGWVAIVADIITLGKFLISKNTVQYWSQQWIASLFFILLLLIVGLGFLRLGGGFASVGISSVFFGTVYFIISLCLYTFLGFTQITKGMPFGEFMGLTALFLLSFSIGLLFFYVLCVHAHHCEYLRWPAYGYAAAMLLLLLGLTDKYVFTGLPVHPDVIIEAIILAVGAAIFFHFHTKGNSEDGE